MIDYLDEIIVLFDINFMIGDKELSFQQKTFHHLPMTAIISA